MYLYEHTLNDAFINGGIKSAYFVPSSALVCQ